MMSIISTFPMLKTRLCLRLRDGNPQISSRAAAPTWKYDETNTRIFHTLPDIPNLTEIEFPSTFAFRMSWLVDAGLEQLASAISRASTLTTLKLGGPGAEYQCGPAAATRLASCLEHCPLLSRLDISNVDAGAAALFACLRHTPRLTALNLANLRLFYSGTESLAAGLREATALEVLRVRYVEKTAYMGSVIAALQHTTSLTVLDLGACCLQGAEAELARALPMLTRLTSLSVMLCGRDAARVVASLPHAPRLKALDLGDFSEREYYHHEALGDEVAAELARALHALPLLTSLGFGHSCVGQAGLEALADALPSAPGLTSINLARLATCKGLDRLLSAAQGLTAVHLRGARLPLDEVVTTLPGCLLRATALQSLDLGGTNLCSIWLRRMVVGLTGAPRLARLHLDHAAIDPSGAETLAPLLQSATALVALRLHHNRLELEGARRLAAGLGSATALTELSLGHNAMGRAAARPLAAALERLTALRDLDLGSNSLGSAGAKAVAAALRRLTGLTWLDVAHNHLCGLGATLVANSLGGATALARLGLAGNEVDYADRVQVAACS